MSNCVGRLTELVLTESRKIFLRIGLKSFHASAAAERDELVRRAMDEINDVFRFRKRLARHDARLERIFVLTRGDDESVHLFVARFDVCREWLRTPAATEAHFAVVDGAYDGVAHRAELFARGDADIERVGDWLCGGLGCGWD